MEDTQAGNGKSATSLGDLLRTAREAKALTQEDLAARLGVTRPAVSQWESGQKPGGPARRLLAQELGLELEVIDALCASSEVA